jgi:hypothetical protein
MLFHMLEFGDRIMIRCFRQGIPIFQYFFQEDFSLAHMSCRNGSKKPLSKRIKNSLLEGFQMQKAHTHGSSLDVLDQSDNV